MKFVQWLMLVVNQEFEHVIFSNAYNFLSLILKLGYIWFWFWPMRSQCPTKRLRNWVFRWQNQKYNPCLRGMFFFLFFWYKRDILNLSKVVSAFLENDGSLKKNCDAPTHGKQDAQNELVKWASPSSDALTRISSWRMIVSEKGEVNVSV